MRTHAPVALQLLSTNTRELARMGNAAGPTLTQVACPLIVNVAAKAQLQLHEAASHNDT